MTIKKNIILLCDDFYPSNTSCSIQMQDLAKEFSKIYNVTIISFCDKENQTSYKNFFQSKLLIIKKDNKNNYYLRFFSEILYSIKIYFYIHKYNINLKKFSYVIWYSPSIFLFPIVYFLKKNFNIKNYLILRDIFPDWLLDLKIIKKSFIFKFLKLFSELHLKTADIIGVQSKSNLKYVSKYLYKSEILYNWLDIETEKPSSPLNRSLKNILEKLKSKKIIIYTGNLGIAQSPEISIDLINKFRDDPNYHFLFIGNGPNKFKLKNLVKFQKILNVSFLDEINNRYLEYFLNRSYMGLVTLDSRHKTHNIPGKFITYLKAALPVVAIINKNNDLNQIILDNKIGLVNSKDTVSLYKEIKSLEFNKHEYSLLKKNSYQLFLSKFASKVAVNQIYSKLNS